MFEVLREYQQGVADQLQDQITSGTLSQVNLFGGSRYSLRMSFALETARGLSCNQGGDDHCSCDSCQKFRNLTVSNVVIISQRDHRSVIETSLSTFERLYNDFSRQFVIQSIRRMLLQYHPALLSGAQTQSQNAAASLAGQVNELLVDFARMEIGNASQAKKAAKEIRSSLKGLFTAAKKNTTVTISQVRALEHWSGQTSMGDGKRFIILEAMEMTNSSARNSLLKMLEEPAKDTYFFLISEYPNRIMQTILSRVRRYAFPPLSRRPLLRTSNHFIFTTNSTTPWSHSSLKVVVWISPAPHRLRSFSLLQYRSSDTYRVVRLHHCSRKLMICKGMSLY
nr:hypothetical protein [uncultured Sphaerochaeta sp.]